MILATAAGLSRVSLRIFQLLFRRCNLRQIGREKWQARLGRSGTSDSRASNCATEVRWATDPAGN